MAFYAKYGGYYDSIDYYKLNFLLSWLNLHIWKASYILWANWVLFKGVNPVSGNPVNIETQGRSALPVDVLEPCCASPSADSDMTPKVDIFIRSFCGFQ